MTNSDLDRHLCSLLKSKKVLPGASLRTRLMLSQLRNEARRGPGKLRLKLSELRTFVANHPNAAYELGVSGGADHG